MNSLPRTFAIIGAGPKGIAVGIRAKVMKEMGMLTDDVIIIEKHSIAAHWSGEAGFTDGEMSLGTSPEKDLVYPIEIQNDETISQKMMERLMSFSWMSYLIQKKTYTDWVDRGRPAPKHSEWASYIKWAASKLSPEVKIIQGEVASIDMVDDQWSLQIRNSNEQINLKANRLMLTGPGKTKLYQNHNHTYDLESFWKNLKNKNFPTSGKLAIVGSGENSASVLLALGDYAPQLEISIISPKGFVSTRAENYYENQFYSRPDEKGWRKLSIEDRIDFIKRTDLGVFSVQAMQILNQQKNHRIIPGRLIEIQNERDAVILSLEYQNEIAQMNFDHVIMATGFDPIASMKETFSHQALKAIEQVLTQEMNTYELSLLIERDLSVRDLFPKLHLPMLSGINQGPGFANLSCLGLLAQRVLDQGVSDV